METPLELLEVCAQQTVTSTAAILPAPTIASPQKIGYVYLHSDTNSDSSIQLGAIDVATAKKITEIAPGEEWRGAISDYNSLYVKTASGNALIDVSYWGIE